MTEAAPNGGSARFGEDVERLDIAGSAAQTSARSQTVLQHKDSKRSDRMSRWQR
jgi:hypothetical protein